jgi:hypothetical protein
LWCKDTIFVQNRLLKDLKKEKNPEKRAKKE